MYKGYPNPYTNKKSNYCF